MANKSKSSGLFIVRIIGICLLIAGIIIFIIKSNADIPEIGEDGWFVAEYEIAQDMQGALSLIMFGIFDVVVSFIKRKANSSNDTIKYVMDTAETKLGDLSQEEKKPLEEEKTNICSYCGKQAKDTESQCSGCGANLY